jgi:hypothetical protein
VLTWPAKDPDEVLDYQLDWNERLADGETISTSIWEVTEGTVTTSAPGSAAGITTIWLTDGIAGETCEINNRVVTSGGRTFDQTIKLRIRNK